MFKSSRILILSLFLIFGISTNAFAVFHKNLWPIWQCNHPLSQETISHEDWQTFLTKYVSTNEEGINLVNYAHITEEDKQLLNRYLGKMAEIDIHLYNRKEQLAYWINIYNALVVQTIIKHYPVNSVEDINTSPGLFSIGPWGTKLITINGIALSLDEIQNRIIRPIWNDMRTLYTLNNGTIGAPNLSKQAYEGSHINKQLNEAAFQYINSLRGIQVIDDEVIASKIIDWYGEDFGDSDKTKLNHLKQFAREDLKKNLEKINTIEHYVYNWHLNSQVGEKP